LVPPPPSALQRHAELADVHAITDRRTPTFDALATELDQHGGWKLWQDEAKAYRQQVGFLRGWAGTLRMDAAIAATTLYGQAVKLRYREQRPFQLDPSITPLGSLPRDSSYPSGHSAASAAAAAVLGGLWPERSARFDHLADSVRWARVYSGVHFPSDTLAGATYGRQIGMRFID
jgi:undecaprenyl-diphosphatase